MLRVIGDVHGKIKQYVQLAEQAEYSLQIGDLGFEYSGMTHLDPTKHRVVAGNHDNYSTPLQESGKFDLQPAHFLGDYGQAKIGNHELFFVRGGHSIDKMYRTQGIDWWPEEQITYAQGMDCILRYSAAEPELVVTHECPVEVIGYVARGNTFDGRYIEPSFTAHLLQAMFDIHWPKLWIFGHYHNNKQFKYRDTQFICIDELSYLDLP